jgi:osmotically-inducible protein OsmY
VKARAQTSIGAIGLAALVAGGACTRSEPDQSARSAAPGSETAQAPAEERSDTALTTAVQARFYTDDAVRGRRIDVSAEDRVVTLRGTVPDEATRTQVVQLARSVEGVTDVRDQLQVKQETASRDAAAETARATGTAGRTPEVGQPAWITTKIQAQYFADSDVKPWNVDVTTASGGVVTLEGAVDGEQARDEAVRIARETEGVTRVENRLRVENDLRTTDPSTSAEAEDTPPDAWLTAKVEAKYFLDDDVKGREIDVRTAKGVVTLTGTVASEAERRQAVAIARNTDGVRDVVDELRVDASVFEPAPATSEATRDRGPVTAPPPAAAIDPVENIDRPDPWITMKIQSKYFLDAEVKGHEIDVDTRNGVVTLTGRVETAEQKAEAEQIARETAGVKSVKNALTVGSR